MRELAKALGHVAKPHIKVPIERTHGTAARRGATIGGIQVHSARLPGLVIAFEALFGLLKERMTIRHDADAGEGLYVAGTLLATCEVLQTTGLLRGLYGLLLRGLYRLTTSVCGSGVFSAYPCPPGLVYASWSIVGSGSLAGAVPEATDIWASELVHLTLNHIQNNYLTGVGKGDKEREAGLDPIAGSG